LECSFWRADPDRASHFLDASVFLKSSEGSKLTGEACKPHLLRPCRFPDDICVAGPHPTCITRKSKQISMQILSKNEKLEPTTERSSSTVSQSSSSIELFEEDIGQEERLGITNEGNEKRTILRQAVAEIDSIDEDKDLNERTTLPPSIILTGKAVWDGNPDREKPACFLNHIINENINGVSTEEEKVAWLDEHSNEICDHTKFQQCVELEPSIPATEANTLDPFAPEPPPVEKGICRCFESSYVLVNNICYIPAGLGHKSNCGLRKINYISVPGRKGGYPNLKPSCVPNSECVSSPNYYGLRCRCKRSTKHDPILHTCNNSPPHGCKMPKPIGFLLICVHNILYISNE